MRFKDIIAHVASRVRTSPIFKRRLVRVPLEVDYPYWADDEYFDVECHIRHGRLPAPGDWRQFCIHLARYHSRPLDMQRPPLPFQRSHVDQLITTLDDCLSLVAH